MHNSAFAISPILLESKVDMKKYIKVKVYNEIFRKKQNEI